ncbi:MAG TPA: acetyl-CoA carboxylase carboxyltransferase subunit beta [Candidatus Onthocola gallistercoris]|uniref:Acetyl-coenzyme A carboxylase carboxyl transferase subunit beta n=1 Tax=Candidatus Onthocola gallistercoris TaxID=2840876 RepID=A0A9D1KWR2_9FIRM|nr:acetyl-CoA carboxylase carboxyltransferase subunit beta [Candidatus Onthocola gallistercoris]
MFNRKNSMFKKATYITLSNRNPKRQTSRAVDADSVSLDGQEREVENGPQVPEGLWEKCPSCKAFCYKEDMEKNLHVCPFCGHHLRIGAWERLRQICDEGSFEEEDRDFEIVNPLEFEGYEDKIRSMREKTGLNEGVVCGIGKIYGERCSIAVMDSNFMMGSMGTIVGEKITRAIERGTRLSLPVIIFTCSGGARMQEGILSLMQMAKTSAAIQKHGQAGLPYFSVVTDPTTGGVTASFAMLGDVILTEPETLIGFAGQRVIEQTIGETLPEGFQRADFMLEHGFVDKIVERKELKNTLYRLILAHKPWTVDDGEA